MIFSSFLYEFTRGAVGDTNEIVTINLSFRALYQINPDHIITLGFASLCGQRKDAGGFNVNENSYAVRLIGKFNETRNIDVSISVPRVGDSINLFDGIGFSSTAPFYAPNDSRILMPADFQIEFDPSSLSQVANGDTIRVICTIGYDLELNGKKFN